MSPKCQASPTLEEIVLTIPRPRRKGFKGRSLPSETNTSLAFQWELEAEDPWASDIPGQGESIGSPAVKSQLVRPQTSIF